MRAGCVLGLGFSLAAPVSTAGAQSLPASVRACAAETDVLRRLACFDREVARFDAPPAPAAAAGAAVVPEAKPAAPAGAAAAGTAVAVAQEHKPAGDTTAPQEPRHVAARLVSIERRRGDLLLHLDNGQVWQRVGEAAPDPSLRAGEAVTIDRVLGSYWLSGRSVEDIKVKRIQ